MSLRYYCAWMIFDIIVVVVSSFFSSKLDSFTSYKIKKTQINYIKKLKPVYKKWIYLFISLCGLKIYYYVRLNNTVKTIK